MDLKYRPAVETDMAFVLASWVESFKDSLYAGPYPWERRREILREAVFAVLARPGVETWVACDPDDADSLVAWVCLERDAQKSHPALHYVYVKALKSSDGFRTRRQGIATALVKAAGIDLAQPFYYTFKTSLADVIIRRMRLSAWWDPVFVAHPKTQVQREDHGRQD